MRKGNRRGIFAIVLTFVLCMLSINVWAAGEGTMLIDDFNRASLGLEKGGAYNTPNSKGIQIYWINWSNAEPKVENNALKLQMKAQGWFGEGAALKDPAYKYIVIKVKGENGGEEKALSLNPDAKGAVKFTDLKGADGKPIPGITKEYQSIVIDIAKSGFKLPDGFEAMHFNNTDPITIYIDEMYLSKDGKVTEAGSSTDNNNGNTAQPSTPEPDKNKPTDSNTNTPQPAASDTPANSTVSPEPTNNQPASSQTENSNVSSSTDNKGLIAGVIGGVTIVAIGAVVYVLYIKKPR